MHSEIGFVHSLMYCMLHFKPTRNARGSYSIIILALLSMAGVPIEATCLSRKALPTNLKKQIKIFFQKVFLEKIKYNSFK